MEVTTAARDGLLDAIDDVAGHVEPVLDVDMSAREAV